MEEFSRVDDDSPDRCQHTNSKGQCKIKKVEGSDFCVNHGGGRMTRTERKKTVSNYDITRYQAELQRHASSPALKTLTDEVAILRMSLERILNSIEDDHDYITHIPHISDMVLKIERLVASCYKLEQQQGQHLDKSQIITFAMQIIQLIGQHVKEPEVLEKIANGINEIITQVEEPDAEH